MTNIGARVYVDLTESLLIIRIYKTFGSVLITILCAVFFYYFLESIWIFTMAVIYAIVEYFGFSDFVFDKKNQVIKKRYGIGRFVLGDSFRHELKNVEIVAKVTYDLTGEGATHDAYLIQLINGTKKTGLYYSKDLTLIKVLFCKLQLSGVASIKWEIKKNI